MQPYWEGILPVAADMVGSVELYNREGINERGRLEGAKVSLDDRVIGTVQGTTTNLVFMFVVD